MNKKIVKLSVISCIIAIVAIAIIVTDDNNVTYAAGTTLAQTVKDKNPTGISSWESGASGVYKTTYTKEDGTEIGSDYRYIGANVNNYVSFNNDMYQIIGVFDENTHGKTGQELVKLIRARILTANTWGVYNNAVKDGSYSSYSNNWTGKGQTTPANLNILLNEYFYNKANTSDTYGSCGNWTYFSNTNDYKIQDCTTLVGYGIEEELRDYIETTTWHLNGYPNNSFTKENIYLCERGLYTGCGPATNADTATEAKIGLMYPSDYMYATGFYGSENTIQANGGVHGNQNWLYKGREWTITPQYDNDNAIFTFSVAASGNIVGSSVGSGGIGQRPTFYLKQDVYVTGGDGSFDNPYTVACDTCSNT